MAALVCDDYADVDQVRRFVENGLVRLLSGSDKGHQGERTREYSAGFHGGKSAPSDSGTQGFREDVTCLLQNSFASVVDGSVRLVNRRVGSWLEPRTILD